MVDIPKQMAYWQTAAAEDWEVATELLRSGRTRHGLFFAHLALEKLLKALVCRQTQELPPRAHNLVRLAELAGLNPSPEQLDVLAEMNEFHIEGRYPSMLLAPPTAAQAQEYVRRAEDIRQWLIRRL